MFPKLKHAVVVTAVAVPAIFLAYRFAVGTRRATNSTSVEAKSPQAKGRREVVEDWSTADVCAWLKEKGVSDSSCDAFSSNDVNGPILLRIDASHLKEIGVVKLADRMRILDALKTIQKDRTTKEDDEDDEVEGDIVEIPPQLPEIQADPPPLPVMPPLPPKRDDQDAMAAANQFIARLKDLYAVFGSDEFMKAPREHQAKIAAEASEELSEMEGMLAHVAPGMREQLEMLFLNLREVVTKIEAIGKPTAVHTVDVTPIISMLNHFGEKLQSEEFNAASEEERKSFVTMVLEQIGKIQQLLPRIPTNQHQDLLEAATAVARIAQLRVAQTSAPERKVPASVGFLLQQLRNIFETLKSPLMKQEPEKRIPIIAELHKSVQSIAQDVALLPDDQKLAIEPVMKNVRTVLDQITAITKQEKELHAQQQLTRDDTAPQATPSLQHIVQQLRGFLGVLKDPKFLQASAETKMKIVEQMETELAKCYRAVNSLSDEQREPLGPLLESISQLLSVVRKEASSAKHVPQHPAGPPTATTVSQSGASTAPSQKFLQTVVAELREVFSVINSDDFKAASRESSREVSRLLLSRLHKIRTVIVTLSAQEQQAVDSLYNSLNDLLSKIIGLPPAAEDEEEETEAPPANQQQPADVNVIVEKLRELYAAVQQPGFYDAPSKERGTMVAHYLAQVSALKEQCNQLPSVSHRDNVLPLIERLEELLTGLCPKVEEIDDDEPAAAKEVEGRKEVFALVVQATAALRSGAVTTVDQMAEFLELMEEVDKLGISSNDEVAVRRQFHRAMMDTMKVVQNAPPPVEDTGASAHHQPSQTASPQHPASALETFVQTFTTVRNEMQKAEPSLRSTSQLIPFMSVIEETLSSADESGLAWRQHPATVRLVSEVLGRVQHLQKELSQNFQPSEVMLLLQQAAQQLHNLQPTSIHQLTPFMEVLEQCSEMEDSFTIEDLKAYQDLQRAVIAASNNLQPATSDDNQPGIFSGDPPPNASGEHEEPIPNLERGDGREALTASLDEMLTELLHRCDAAGSDKNTLQRIMNVLDSIEPSAKGDTAMMLRLEALRRHTTEKLASIPSGEAVKKIAVQLTERLEDPNFEQLPEDDKMQVAVQATRLLQSLTADQVQEMGTVHERLYNALSLYSMNEDEAITGGIVTEIGLLPRIMERLQQPDFVEDTTVFEMKCIGTILNRISGSLITKKNADLRVLVASCNTTYESRMSGFDGTNGKDPSTTLVPLLLTGLDSENEDSQQPVRHFTVLSAEEAEEYTINEPLVDAFNRPARSATVAGDIEAWEDRSIAFILGFKEQPHGGTTRTTLLPELMTLCDILDRKHGFDIVAVTHQGVSAASFQEVVSKTLEEQQGVSRVVFYCHTPVPNVPCPPMYCVSFPDGSVLRHGDLLSLCPSSVKSVAVLHDCNSTFQSLVRMDGQRSMHLAISLTQGAAQVANTSRYWLFDGVFTPIVSELLTQDDAEWISAEDVVNYLASQLCGLQIEYGSYTGDGTISAPLFGPRPGYSENEEDI